MCSTERTFRTRTAELTDQSEIRAVLDAAMLAIECDLSESITSKAVSLRVAECDQRVVGVCRIALQRQPPTEWPSETLFERVDAIDEITHIAVRQQFQSGGIATALVSEILTDNTGAVGVEFHPQVKPFYEQLGFDICSLDTSEDVRRCVGLKSPA
ncbi:MAG: acetyltransferase (GNAT) family [Haloquadratum sp. J07HQX50]|jgi:Acetyltransferase (GNAT) family.|nr:MAG: acetyltransferase (GNAT) family [Haloquadratum sp. J07HQX50]